ncbi:hypothetical protein AOLI_G00321790 [Acnodon oligacanthus]
MCTKSLSGASPSPEHYSGHNSFPPSPLGRCCARGGRSAAGPSTRSVVDACARIRAVFSLRNSLPKAGALKTKVKNHVSCLTLSEGLKDFDPGDTVYNATEWSDLADGFDGKWKKKNP